MKTKIDCKLLPMKHNLENEELAKSILGLIRSRVNSSITLGSGFYTPREIVMEAKQEENAPYSYTLKVYAKGENELGRSTQDVGTWKFEFNDYFFYIVEL